MDDTESRTVILEVDGMTCSGCAASIEGILKREAGVESATVDFESRTTTIRYDPAQTNPESLAGRVTRAGFTVVGIR